MSRRRWAGNSRTPFFINTMPAFITLVPTSANVTASQSDMRMASLKRLQAPGHCLPRLHNASLKHGDESGPIFKHADVGKDVAVDDQDVRELAGFQSANFLVASQNLGARASGAGDRL